MWNWPAAYVYVTRLRFEGDNGVACRSAGTSSMLEHSTIIMATCYTTFVFSLIVLLIRCCFLFISLIQK